MLRKDSATWQQAQWLLAFYLFSSFSLLVTTSFLGLRRYLRQRGVDMPANVSIGWLAGGVAMTAAIISLAYFVPMPGNAIASLKMSDWIDSPKDFSANRFGWGKEGAQKSNQGDASIAEDAKPEGNQTQDTRAQEGAPPGDSGDGKRKDGPPGKQDGGNKSAGDQTESESKAKSENAKQASESENAKGQENQSEQSEGNPSEKSSTPEKEDGSEDAKSDSKSDDAQNRKDNQASQEKRNAESSEQNADDNSEQDSNRNSEPRSDSSAKRGESPPQRPSSSTPMFGGLFSALGNVLKFLLIIVLLGITGGYLWINRDSIVRWWNSLFDRPKKPQSLESASPTLVDTSDKNRPFASFRNPIGREEDPRRVMVITFQAFEAWTREHGWTREKDETPSEFLQRVAGALPQMSAAATSVVQAYNRIVYGRGRPTQADIDAAKAVWQAMR
jgi:hypothetical protein